VTFEKDSELEEICGLAFLGTDLETIEIPSRCKALTAHSVLGIHSIVISKENPFFVIEEGSIMSRDGKRFVMYMAPETQVLIKKEIEVIGCNCFTRISEVIFEPGSLLRRIERCAFKNSALQVITIPSSVEEIQYECFLSCKSLRELLFEAHSKLQHIGAYAFRETALKSIMIPSSVEQLDEGCFSACSLLNKIVFEPNSRLRRIGRAAFHSIALKTVTIPSSVELIGELCFGSCKSLCEVTFEADVRGVSRNAFDACPLRVIRAPFGMQIDLNVYEEYRIEYF
jgi:hypothetical protein